MSIFTRVGVRRIARFAFQLAESRPRRKLTYVTKSNAQRNGMVMWDEVIKEVANEFPGVEVDHMLVDAMTVRMVLHPESLDTIVATNLHADILSDLAAALAGSIGIAPTANLDPSGKNPSMFEPIRESTSRPLAQESTSSPPLPLRRRLRVRYHRPRGRQSCRDFLDLYGDARVAGRKAGGR